jgi:CRP-like cAMP-binding protein/predicted MFS family arabinose efflux permease
VAGTEQVQQSGLRAALAYHDFRWLMIGLSVSSVGTWAYNVALYVYVFETTGSPTWAAATSVGRFVPALIMSSYSGIVAERFERRRLLIALDLAYAVMMVSLAVVTGLDLGPLLAIVLASVASVIGTGYYPATAALTPQIVEERDLAAANAFQGAVENVSTIAGPALGALILAVSSVPVALAVNAAAFLFSAWCSTRVRTRSVPSDVTDGGTAGVLAQIATGLRAIRSSTTALVLVGASVFGTFFFGADTVLFLVLAEDKLGLGADGLGLLLSALGVGGVLIAPLVSRVAGSRRLATIISLAMIAFTLPTAALVWVDAAAVGIGIQVVRGAATLALDVLAVTALQRSLPPEMIARVFGIFGALSLGAVALGALVMPVSLNLLGLDGTLLLVSVGASGLVVVAYPFTRRVDRELADRLAALEPRIAALSGLGIFSSASRAMLERLAAAAEEVSTPAGTRIITQGEPADAFYVLIHGTVTVSKTVEDGTQQSLQTLGAGEFFGEIGLLEAGERTANVDADTAVELLKLPGDEFIAALTEAPPTTAFLEVTRMRLASSDPGRRLTARAIHADDG